MFAIAIDLEVARIRATAAAAILQAIIVARNGQVAQARQGLAAAAATVKTAATHYPELADLVIQLDQVDHEIAQIVPADQVVRDQRPQQPAKAPKPETETQLRRVEDEARAELRGE